MYIAHVNPVAALQSDADRHVGSDSTAVRVCRLLVSVWLRQVERRTEAALRQLDHAGLLEDFQASRRDRFSVRDHLRR
jgi:hypothetical protein